MTQSLAAGLTESSLIILLTKTCSVLCLSRRWQNPGRPPLKAALGLGDFAEGLATRRTEAEFTARGRRPNMIEACLLRHDANQVPKQELLLLRCFAFYYTTL